MVQLRWRRLRPAVDISQSNRRVGAPRRSNGRLRRRAIAVPRSTIPLGIFRFSQGFASNRPSTSSPANAVHGPKKTLPASSRPVDLVGALPPPAIVHRKTIEPARPRLRGPQAGCSNNGTRERVMEDFPIWLKIIIFATVGLTVLYSLWGMFHSIFAS